MLNWGRRVIGISGSLIWSKTLMELILNPCGEFRWNPEGPVSKIHSPPFLIGAPGIFSDLLRSVQMLKREWGAESNGKLPHLFIPTVVQPGEKPWQECAYYRVSQWIRVYPRLWCYNSKNRPAASHSPGTFSCLDICSKRSMIYLCFSFETWFLKVNFESRARPRYLTEELYGITWFWILIGDSDAAKPAYIRWLSSLHTWCVLIGPQHLSHTTALKKATSGWLKRQKQL